MSAGRLEVEWTTPHCKARNDADGMLGSVTNAASQAPLDPTRTSTLALLVDRALTRPPPCQARLSTERTSLPAFKRAPLTPPRLISQLILSHFEKDRRRPSQRLLDELHAEERAADAVLERDAELVVRGDDDRVAVLVAVAERDRARRLQVRAEGPADRLHHAREPAHRGP
eukprot:1737459-Rhodomonas_salina.1